MGDKGKKEEEIVHVQEEPAKKIDGGREEEALPETEAGVPQDEPADGEAQATVSDSPEAVEIEETQENESEESAETEPASDADASEGCGDPEHREEPADQMAEEDYEESDLEPAEESGQEDAAEQEAEEVKEEIEEVEEESDDWLSDLEEDETYEELPADDDDELSEEEQALKKHRRKKRRRRILLCLVLLLAAAYGGAYAYFTGHFYPNTSINGTDVSFCTVAQVQAHMKQEVQDYELQMEESDGGIESIAGSDISLEYVPDDSVQKILDRQEPVQWIAEIWERRSIEASVGVEFDQEKLDAVLAELDCMAEENQEPSVSAKPEFTGVEFQITPEQVGTEIDAEKFAETVKKALNGFLPTVDLMEEGCYILPKYLQDSPEVIAARDQMNSQLGASITLDFSPYTEVVDSTVIYKWIQVDENMQVTFDQEAVKTYVAELAEKYDTYGKTRTFVTGSGNTVQVEGGSYGWQLDQETEYETLIANIQNAETVTREPSYLRRAATHEANDYGTTYAEVDLTAQHMYYFQNGQLVMQSDVVTGNPNKGNGTPQGTYSLSYKTKDAVLRGKKLEDGTYEYESPVSYWMPFNGGIGFHDASWQSAFGGNRYLTYGSHGCINMPPASAAELYSYIEAGVPVICHY